MDILLFKHKSYNFFYFGITFNRYKEYTITIIHKISNLLTFAIKLCNSKMQISDFFENTGLKPKSEKESKNTYGNIIRICKSR